MWTNYKLTKLMVKKCGIIYGQNQYGSEWLELRWKGNNIKTLWLKNENPAQASIDIKVKDLPQTIQMEVINNG